MEWLLRCIPSLRNAMSEKRSDNDVAGSINVSSEVVSPSISIAPYEHPVIYDYLGKNRYLQASFCKSVARLYSDKFGMYTARTLSYIAAEEGFSGVLAWSKEIGCCWDKSVFVSGAKGGHVDILKFLKDNNCPMPDENGRVAWIAAAERGHLEVLKFAHTSAYLQHIQRVCEVAAENDHLHILKWVYEVEGNRYFNAYTCQQAAMGGFIEIINWLRSVGCEWDKSTCLSAIIYGHLGVLKWALDNGCPWDVNDRDLFGRTGLHFARDPEMIEFLISRGANSNAVDAEGRTPIYWAAQSGEIDVVVTFVKLGADVNIACGEDFTPLDIAIMHERREIVEVLRAAGARESS